MIQLRRGHVSLAFSLIFFAKALVLGVSIPECLGLLVILASEHTGKVLAYLFPKRVNLHQEFVTQQAMINEVKLKIEEQESDITALKFARSR